MSLAPSDCVLAISCEADPERQLAAARAAVAELIAASRDAAAVLQDKAGPLEQETPRRLYAALANVGVSL